MSRGIIYIYWKQLSCFSNSYWMRFRTFWTALVFPKFVFRNNLIHLHFRLITAFCCYYYNSSVVISCGLPGNIQKSSQWTLHPLSISRYISTCSLFRIQLLFALFTLILTLYYPAHRLKWKYPNRLWKMYTIIRYNWMNRVVLDSLKVPQIEKIPNQDIWKCPF